MLEIIQLPVWTDNYVYLLRDDSSGKVAVVDPADASIVLTALAERNWQLDYIFNTHHHPDHVGGNRELKNKMNCTIVGPRADRDRIPGIDQEVGDGDQVGLGNSIATVFDTPGHTKGHISYYFASDDALFCGDTLFSMGCGRLFEGTPKQMWNSLLKLRTLPDTTRVYCAHEYTEANVRFARSIEPQHEMLKAYELDVLAKRRAGRPTIPSLLKTEKDCNPFLRADQPDLAMAVDASDPVDVFAEVRSRKDRF
jgi:hydroxyacylglutathione hydrolase